MTDRTKSLGRPNSLMARTTTLPRQSLTEKQLHDLRHAFNIFDADGSGNIDKEELKSVLKSLGVKPDDAEMDRLMKQMDADGSGTIDFDEFVEVMADKLEDDELEKQLEDLAATFKLMDTDGSGSLDAEELRKAMKRMGVVMTQGEVDFMMKMVDVDGDGSVTYEEFVKFVLEYELPEE